MRSPMLRALGLATLVNLAGGALPAQTIKTILQSGPVANRYDIVILGDGYQAFEEGKFDQDALAAVNQLFGKPSYRTYKSFFNVHTVFRASNESGADHPDANPPIWKDTVYNASYNTGGTPRCLYIGNTSLANADSRLAPDVEGRVMVLVNDTRYGGCGGTFSVSYTGSSGPEVQAHEFGHSFGRLADEYDYGNSGTYTGPEPSQANITADSTGMIKWPLWLGYNGISTYQGAGYYQTGLWRPKQNCLMRALGVPLCEICDEQIVKQCYVTVDPIENRSPAVQLLTVNRSNPPAFSITSLVPGASTIVWRVDGQQVATGTTGFSWNLNGVPSGRHQVSVTVQDLTAFVRKDPTHLLTTTTTWTVDVLSTRPGAYTTFGNGCPGSGSVPGNCLSANTGGAHQGLLARDNVTYAVRVRAPSALTVSGFEFLTNSPQGTVQVAVELYTADPSGAPLTRVRTGTMTVGLPVGWYQGKLLSPYTVAAGQDFLIAFVSPSPGIGASIVTGTPTPYYRNDGPNGTWVGPYTGYAWAYRIQCAAGGAVPSLSASGVPEIGTAFDVLLDRAAANAAGGLLVGTSNTSWSSFQLPYALAGLGAPGCLLLASPDVVLPVRTDAQGAASVRIPIPNVGALVDAPFFNQFYVVDSPANTLGIAWSDGGAGKIGQP